MSKTTNTAPDTIKKAKPNSYCEYALSLPTDNVHRIYHDSQYGFVIEDDNELFGRLILEINQAGLSWNTILNKQHNFRKAFDDFDIEKIANYGDLERERLLNDAGIIRNKLKVNAVIYNAQQVQKLQEEYGSFKAWLDHYYYDKNHSSKTSDKHPMTRADWVKLFKKTFKFTGGEITNEFLMSTGYLNGCHVEDCPVYLLLNKKKPG